MRLYRTKYSIFYIDSNLKDIIIDSDSCEKINQDEDNRECDLYHSVHRHGTGFYLDGERIDEDICIECTTDFEEWLSEEEQKKIIILIENKKFEVEE